MVLITYKMAVDEASERLERNWYITTTSSRTVLRDGQNGRSWSISCGCCCSVITRWTKVSFPKELFEKHPSVHCRYLWWDPNYGSTGYFQVTCADRSRRYGGAPPSQPQTTWCPGWPCVTPWSPCCPGPGRTWASPYRTTSKNPSVTFRITCWKSVSLRVAKPVSNTVSAQVTSLSNWHNSSQSRTRISNSPEVVLYSFHTKLYVVCMCMLHWLFDFKKCVNSEDKMSSRDCDHIVKCSCTICTIDLIDLSIYVKYNLLICKLNTWNSNVTRSSKKWNKHDSLLPAWMSFLLVTWKVR